MADEDLHRYRKVSPESEEEWQRLHRAADRADKAWIVNAPLVAFAVNWKAWVFAIAMLALLRRTEVIAVLDMLAGTSK